MLPARKLDRRALEYIARQMGRKRAATVASEMGVKERWIYAIWARVREEGGIPEPKAPGRPSGKVSPAEERRVLAAHARDPGGVVRTARRLRAGGSKISYHRVYQVMRDGGLTGSTGRRSNRRKWVRYERRYSNAMWHADWHAVKGGSSLRGKWLIAYLDDSSRCVTGFGVFEEATSENALLVLDIAIGRFGIPAQMLTDHGTQFTPAKKPASGRAARPNAFGRELARLGIAHVLARVGHPQTNGKLERFFGTFEREWEYFGGVADYISHYNEDRLHFSLDMDSGETPRRAFTARRATRAIRKSNPRWFEEDMNQALK